MSATTCLVCSAPLTALHARTAPLCGNAACRARYDATPPYRRCSVCARPLAADAIAGGHCRGGACERQVVVVGLRRRQRALLDRATAFRDRAARRARVSDPTAFVAAIVPSLRVPIASLPARRRRLIVARLTALATEAAARRARGDAAPPADGGPVLASEVNAALGAACGRCRGQCCTTGRDHAYLDVDLLHRFMDAHPSLDVAAVVATYAAYMGPRTVRGSCAFHRADGCALPRDMRADICNRFLCRGLTQIRAAAADGAARAFVVTADDPTDVATAFTSGAFVDARDVRVVRARAVGGTSPALAAPPPD